MSLCAIGTPCSGPRSTPLASSASASRAAASASSRSMRMKQLSAFCTLSARASTASIAATHVPAPEALAELDRQCDEPLPAGAIEAVHKFNAGEYHEQHDEFEALWMR